MTETKLKPCPFCGGKAIMHYETTLDGLPRIEIICTNCPINLGYIVVTKEGTEDIVALWNTRAGETK